MIKSILKIIGVLILGALGALIFTVFLLPYLLTNPYFENYQFVKDFKQGKIVVNQKESVYIQENTAIQSAIERVKNSVVTIQGNSIASGLILTSDGSIVTLASVIPDNGKFNVFLMGESVNFKMVKVDYKNNLALLKIDKNNLQTVAFADSDKIKLGQKVFLVAPVSAKHDNWFANEGIIREINKDFLTGLVQVVKTNITERVIASGSPLFNSVGELVGLNFIDQENKISAIPIDKIQILLGL